jgi:hypothetical protein
MKSFVAVITAAVLGVIDFAVRMSKQRSCMAFPYVVVPKMRCPVLDEEFAVQDGSADWILRQLLIHVGMPANVGKPTDAF